MITDNWLKFSPVFFHEEHFQSCAAQTELLSYSFHILYYLLSQVIQVIHCFVFPRGGVRTGSRVSALGVWGFATLLSCDDMTDVKICNSLLSSKMFIKNYLALSDGLCFWIPRVPVPSPSINPPSLFHDEGSTQKMLTTRW